MSKDNKVVLVTGGSGGLGSTFCKIFADRGYDVVVNYNSSEQKSIAVLESLEKGNHSIFKASITSESDLSEMVHFVQEKYGKLDVLINNSGITKSVPHNDLKGLTNQWIDKIFQLNVRGTYACIRAFEPLLKVPLQSIIINISSIAGLTAVGSNIAYCASKAAVDSMTKSLARVLAPKVRVVSLSPGWIDGEYARKFSKDYIDEQIQKTPLNRISKPYDIAKAAVAIVEQFTFSTGCIFPVDGGRPLI